MTLKKAPRIVVTDKGLVASMPPNLRPIRWEPKAFVLENPKLKSRIIEETVIEEGRQAFEENPRQPLTYVVAGNPDDAEALYYAFYLMEVHKRAVRFANPLCVPVLGNFDPVLKPGGSTPTMLVMHNLSPLSSNLKYEKVRDTLAQFPRIPTVLVVAGEDPISFAARIHVPCHALAYFTAKTFTAVQEVI